MSLHCWQQNSIVVMYTVCPGSVRTVFIKNTRRELFSKFHSFIQNSLLLNQYIARIDLKFFENSHCTPFVESHLKLRYIPFGCPGWCRDGLLSSNLANTEDDRGLQFLFWPKNRAVFSLWVGALSWKSDEEPCSWYSRPQTIDDSEIIIRIHCLAFWQKFLVNDSLGIEENG
jgi:hypothetical protein